MTNPPIKKPAGRGLTIKPGKFTIKQLLDSTRANFKDQDWARSQAAGRPFAGDKGLTYNTKLTLQKPSRAPHGVRFGTTTTAPEEFGKDARGRFPRKWVQYVELPHDYDRNNVRGHKEFKVYCNCMRFKFVHHYVLWKAGHAPQPYDPKGRVAPDWARRGTRAVGVCKHLTLALLAINKASAQNKLPDMLPDKAWREIERYWAQVEAGNHAKAMEANLKNAPDSVKKLAAKTIKAKPTVKPASKADWSDRGFKIPKPR